MEDTLQKVLTCITCTDTGEQLAEKVCALWDRDWQITIRRCSRDGSLKDLTKSAFETSDAVLYISATGIAVRAIAPYLQNKAKDPAILCMDELGTFTISLVSGHLGGANGLTRMLSERLGNIPVITTATDLHGVFAVDEWSKKQNCALLERTRIKGISSAVLQGMTVTVFSPWRIDGEEPAYVTQGDLSKAGVVLDYHLGKAEALHLVPRILHVGIGCRRDTPQEKIEAAYARVLEEQGICEEAVKDLATIDLKKDEKGLLAFARAHERKLKIFTSEELLAVPGEYTESSFVKSITGVSNVCERSAMAAGGTEIIVRKFPMDGVTIAIAAESYSPDWQWL